METAWVALPENQSAWRAALAFADACCRTREHPLLYLHGPSGAGKTHLVNEIVRRFFNTQAEASAQVVAAADVGRELQLPTIERRDLMRSLAACDLLVIEDVQHLPATAGDDFTTIIDKRLNRRKYVLVTGGVGPGALETSPRLLGRLVGGLVVGLGPWSHESRRLFAETLCQECGLQVTPEVLTWLARHPGGGRPIRGEVQQLQTLATLYPPPLTLELVQRELPESAVNLAPLERIIACVAAHYRITPKLLRSKSRLKNIVWPRQVSMYLAKQQGLSLVAISKHFGQRDHTTVRHSCEKVAQRLEQDLALVQTLQELQAKLV